MIETNPGQGLGLLLAYFLFGPRSLRPTAPAAMIIQFLGGIHEIYFPYVLMKPRLIIAMIAGGGAGVGTFMVTNAGLVATPSPGSIFAYLAVTPKGGWFGVVALLLGFGRGEPAEEDEAITPEEQAERDAAQKAAAERTVAANKAASKLGTGTVPEPRATTEV